MGEFNVNKSDGSLDPTAGMPETYPAEQVMMSDGTTSVEDALNAVDAKLSLGSVQQFDISMTADTNPRLILVAYATNSRTGDYVRVDFDPANNKVRYRVYDSQGTATYDKSATLA